MSQLITLDDADVRAIRALRLSGHGSRVESILRRLQAELRRRYTEQHASEAARVTLAETTESVSLLFTEAL